MKKDKDAQGVNESAGTANTPMPQALVETFFLLQRGRDGEHRWKKAKNARRFCLPEAPDLVLFVHETAFDYFACGALWGATEARTGTRCDGYVEHWSSDAAIKHATAVIRKHGVDTARAQIEKRIAEYGLSPWGRQNQSAAASGPIEQAEGGDDSQESLCSCGCGRLATIEDPERRGLSWHSWTCKNEHEIDEAMVRSKE